MSSYLRDTTLVLLDGLDEVPSLQYPKAREAISGLSEKLGQLGTENIIIITMRTQFHQYIKDEYQDSVPHIMFLKPFSPSDVYEFLTRWPFQKEHEQKISRIFNELSDRPTLREMCSNPLILSMYVAENQASGYDITPETRTEFYLKVTEELIIKRRLRQTGPTIARTKLKEQRERILGILAYDHLLDPSQPVNSLKWSEALEVISNVFGCDKEKAESIFRELAKDTGLVTEERIGENFRFIHLTICEFLAANEAVQGKTDGWSKLIDTHRQFKKKTELHLHSRLLEVIPFACGLLPRIHRPRALDDLSEVSDWCLLARAFLETKLYDHPSVVSRK